MTSDEQLEFMNFLKVTAAAMAEIYPDHEFLIASYPRVDPRDQACAHTCCEGCFTEQVKLLAFGSGVRVDAAGAPILNGESVH